VIRLTVLMLLLLLLLLLMMMSMSMSMLLLLMVDAGSVLVVFGSQCWYALEIRPKPNRFPMLLHQCQMCRDAGDVDGTLHGTMPSRPSTQQMPLISIERTMLLPLPLSLSIVRSSTC
jgi:hypothetical protein